MRKVQISVGSSPAELLQDEPAGGRQLQRGEVRPALPLTGRARQEVPADAQLPAPLRGRLIVSAAATAQHAEPHAVCKEPAQTQTQIQIPDGFGPVLCRVTVQSESIRGGERHELLFGEVFELVVFILSGCHGNKGQTKRQQQQQRVSLRAKCNHDKKISDMLVRAFLCFPPSVRWSAEALRGLWEFWDWAFQRGMSRVSNSCHTHTAAFLY